MSKTFAGDITQKQIRDDIEILDNIADWMDSKFKIPGTQIRFGVDSILGLIPGLGDTIGLAISSYVIKVAHQYEAPLLLKLRMAWNIFIDWLIGLIPFIGDIFDVGFKANKKNVALLRKHMDDTNMIV